eukprot:8240387-Pyramimonas_sp.AAC.1
MMTACYVGRAPSFSPDRARARSSGARSSGIQCPHPPGAGNSSGPPGEAPRAHAPPGRERPWGIPPQDDQHRGEESPEGQLLRLKGWSMPGLARQHIPAEAMEYWLNEGWTEHPIRHLYSLRQAKRSDADTIIR